MITPVVPSAGALRPVESVVLTGGFWRERDPVAMIEHCREWMERLGWIDNFLAFGGKGRVFADSEVYKLLEAMAWAGHDGLPELAAVVSGAQGDDGYLNTRFRQARYSDFEWGHELYCFGHLIQAGVASLRTGASDLLTETAIRAADHVCREFGERSTYCGHPEIEMALVELFRVTGDERYLVQAKAFVDRRGSGALGPIEFGPEYFQDDMPVRSRAVFAGHVVRELYLACGAADVAVETGDSELLDTVIAQFDETVARRTYVTGGMGSRHEGESFGEDFELPPDLAYSETCAGIGSVMLAWRLLLATGAARYADLIERTLFNVVAAAVGADLRSFFYANPLQQRRPSVPSGFSSRAVTGQRAPWFEVSCCPTNLARTFAAYGGYFATHDASGIQIQQYASMEVRHEDVVLSVVTDYPWSGRVTVRVVQTPERPWELRLRVPNAGYKAYRRAWRTGDEVVLELDVSPRWTFPDPRIDAVRGCVAVEAGPLVYCAETPAPLDTLEVDTSVAPVLEGRSIRVETRNVLAPELPWPYGAMAAAKRVETSLDLIPYHRWANHGPSCMRVWLPLMLDSD